MSLKIILIAPKYANREALFWNVSYALRTISSQLNREIKAPTYSMALPTIAALIQQVAEDADIQIIDESVTEIEFYKLKADLVCISAHTLQVKRAFQIAENFKETNPQTKVVLGGAHVGNTIDAEIIKEALTYVDTVVVGESDNIWKELLGDLAGGNLKESYFGNHDIAQFDTLLLPRFDLLSLDSYLFRNMEASRGCNRRCSFCNVATKLRFKNPDHVVAEIKHLREIEHKQGIDHRSIFFTDSLLNPLGHEDKIKRLMEKLIYYREEKYLGDDLGWFGQVNAQIVMDEFDELLSLMSRAGAKRLLIGFEGFYFDKHAKAGKALTIAQRKKDFLAVIKTVRSKGIDVFGSFVVGFDDEPQKALTELEDFINESGLVLAQISLRTPFPGTRDFKQFRKEGRLFGQETQGYDWNQYTGAKFVFKPKQAIKNKQQDYYELLNRIYSDEAIKKRVAIREQTLPYGPLDNLAEQLYVKSFQEVALGLSQDRNKKDATETTCQCLAANT